MIKNIVLRRFCIGSLLFIVALVLYSYPKELNKNIDTYFNKRNIYLIDLNNFVSLTEIKIKDEVDVSSMIENTISCLTIGSSCETDGFKKILPKNTKLLNYSISEDILKVNFNTEILNISKENEEKMLECLIFSLTEIDGINRIMIFVNGKILSTLPHSSKKLDIYLDRSFGINKIYNINNIRDTSIVTVYYLDNSNSYYIPVSYITNDNNKLEIIIKSLKTNNYPVNNLSSLLDYQVELIDYIIEEDELTLNFNNLLLNSVIDGNLDEEVKYALYYSVKDSLGIENIVFSINNKKIDYLGLAK